MNTTSLQRIAAASLTLALVVLTGCAQIPLGAPVASIDNIQKAKANGMAPVNVGEFKATAKDDKGLNVRSNTVSSPIKGSFAEYLKENLSVELRAAGLLTETSDIVIRGDLTDNLIDTSPGRGSLGAKFMVDRAGKKVFEKDLHVQSTWESSFVGAIAIPAAINNYTSLYRELIAKLLDDAEFRRAVAR